MTSIITAPISKPFDNYRWIWASLTARESYKSAKVFPQVLKTMYKYENLTYNSDFPSGQNFHADLLSLHLTDESGNPLSFHTSGRSFIRGYQTYWTSPFAIFKPSITSPKHLLNLTPLGKALATNQISYKDFLRKVIGRFQFPNLITQETQYTEWLSNGVVFKPFIQILDVLLELNNLGGFSNAYVSEQETAIFIAPLTPTLNKTQIAREILAFRREDPSLNHQFIFTDFFTESNSYRNVKEFLQVLSIAEFLVLNKKNVRTLVVGSTLNTSELRESNCYHLNIFTGGKWGQLTSEQNLIQDIETFCLEAEKEGYFSYTPVSPPKNSIVEYTKFMGRFYTTSPKMYTFNAKTEKLVSLLETHKQILIAGVPGVGKTRIAHEIAEVLEHQGKLGTKEVVLFHQSYSYEDFIEGIRPSVNNHSVNYFYKQGKFKLLCEKAKADQNRYYILIIDEINRGNISSILGELIYLIEPQYRSSFYQIDLPYTGESFWVPENVLIIGTMNTTDKSAIELDLALRRRFKYIKLTPDPEVVQEQLNAISFSLSLRNGTTMDVPKILKNLNQIISDDSGLGSDFQIGHSYFLPTNGREYDEDYLLEIWNYSVIPLLNEYILLSPRFKNSLEENGFIINNDVVLDVSLDELDIISTRLSGI